MAGPNVRIDGTPLSPAPSSFEAIPPKASRVQVLNGGYESAPRTKGWRFIITYGSSQFAHPDSLDNIRTRLGSRGSTTTLVYRDHTGSDQTHTVLVDEAVGDIFGIGGLAKSFSVELVEAP